MFHTFLLPQSDSYQAGKEPTWSPPASKGVFSATSLQIFVRIKPVAWVLPSKAVLKLLVAVEGLLMINVVTCCPLPSIYFDPFPSNIDDIKIMTNQSVISLKTVGSNLIDVEPIFNCSERSSTYIIIDEWLHFAIKPLLQKGVRRSIFGVCSAIWRWLISEHVGLGVRARAESKQWLEMHTILSKVANQYEYADFGLDWKRLLTCFGNESRIDIESHSQCNKLPLGPSQIGGISRSLQNNPLKQAIKSSNAIYFFSNALDHFVE